MGIITKARRTLFRKWTLAVSVILPLLIVALIVLTIFVAMPPMFTAAITSSTTTTASSDNAAINLSNNSGESTDPRLIVSGSNLYVVWQDKSSGNGDIFFKKSANGGTTFGNTINLSKNEGISESPIITARGDNVYVVWVDDTSGNQEIFFKRSTNGGESFGKTIKLSTTSLPSGQPEIASSGNNVYIIWSDISGEDEFQKQHILFKRSVDEGATFSTAKEIDVISGHLEQRIAASGNNLYVVWSGGFETPDYLLFFRRSVDNGNSFGDRIVLSHTKDQFGDIGAENPRIAVAGSHVYVVWNEQYVNGIFFRKSNDGGASFEDIVNLEQTADARSSNPWIAVVRSAADPSLDQVYVAWEQGLYNGQFDQTEIVLRSSGDSGTEFDLNRRTIHLTNNEGQSSFPQISAPRGGPVRIIWLDDTLGNSEVMYRSSDDDAQSFSNGTNLSSNEGESTNAVMRSAGSDNAYVVWQDNTPGNSDIFFRRLSNSE